MNRFERLRFWKKPRDPLTPYVWEIVKNGPSRGEMCCLIAARPASVEGLMDEVLALSIEMKKRRRNQRGGDAWRKRVREARYRLRDLLEAPLE